MSYMKKLPIHEVLEDIKSSLRNNSSLILQAPPGAGKSTLVPISFLNEPWLKSKKIIMLEPRRVAARMLASQMSRLLDEEVGTRVGYQIKMDSCFTKETKILIVTEAILIKKLQNNQTLDDTAMIIFDEFHERSIHTDLSLALSIQVQELLREDLKLLVMSATLNSQAISTLLLRAQVINSEGKTYDVQNRYLDIRTSQPDNRDLNKLLLQYTLKAIKEDEGDILVFLPGIKEIKKLQNSLNNSLDSKDVLVLPLHSTLSKQEQDRALKKSIKRKIILCTNIAQTSLTIEGIKIVIDSGLEKVSQYNYSNGMNHLELSFISKDSATQRAGRAGRLSNGKCYRLWHENKILQQSTKPEILRSDLSSVLLDLSLWGAEFEELKFLDIPDLNIIQKTKETLLELEMLDSSFKITKFGKDGLKLGLHPRLAYMILKANDINYAYEACILAALLNEKDIFQNNYKDSDILSRFTHLFDRDFDTTYINRSRANEVLKQTEFFYNKLKAIKKVQKRNTQLKQDMISVLLLFAYPDRLAKQRSKNDSRYKLSNSKGAVISNEDTLFNKEYLVVASLNAHDKDSFIHLGISISLERVKEHFKHLINEKQSISYNKENKKFDFRVSSNFLSLELEQKPLKNSSNIDFKKLLLDLIYQEGLEFLNWSKKAVNLKDRLNFINHHDCSSFKDFSSESLLDSMDTWLEPYLDNISTLKALQDLDIYTILLGKLSWDEQKLLERLAPLSVKVQSGSNIFIDYSYNDKPSISVRLQEMFGMNDIPKILNNTVALQIQLLSPASRPVAITYDLKSFWENSYQEVAKELRGKYKKHYWPENPFKAVATNKTKKFM